MSQFKVHANLGRAEECSPLCFTNWLVLAQPGIRSPPHPSTHTNHTHQDSLHFPCSDTNIHSIHQKACKTALHTVKHYCTDVFPKSYLSCWLKGRTNKRCRLLTRMFISCNGLPHTPQLDVFVIRPQSKCGVCVSSIQLCSVETVMCLMQQQHQKQHNVTLPKVHSTGNEYSTHILRKVNVASPPSDQVQLE